LIYPVHFVIQCRIRYRGHAGSYVFIDAILGFRSLRSLTPGFMLPPAPPARIDLAHSQIDRAPLQIQSASRRSIHRRLMKPADIAGCDVLVASPASSSGVFPPVPRIPNKQNGPDCQGQRI
jgi:hypothetical protein